jgi:hypothetical protein
MLFKTLFAIILIAAIVVNPTATGCGRFGSWDAPRPKLRVKLELDTSGSTVGRRAAISKMVELTLATDGGAPTQVLPAYFDTGTRDLPATDSSEVHSQLREWEKAPLPALRGTNLGSAFQDCLDEINSSKSPTILCVATDGGFEDDPQKQADALSKNIWLKAVVFVGVEADGTGKFGKLKRLVTVFGDRAFLIPRHTNPDFTDFRAVLKKLRGAP